MTKLNDTLEYGDDGNILISISDMKSLLKSLSYTPVSL